MDATSSIRNRTMEKIELTEEQVKYIITYIEDEEISCCLMYDKHGKDWISIPFKNAIEAYNGGAR